jgi:hypothetical protein
LENLKKLSKSAYPTLDEDSREVIVKPIYIRGLLSDIREHLKFREFASLDEAHRAARYVENQIRKEEFQVGSYNNVSLFLDAWLVLNQ